MSTESCKPIKVLVTPDCTQCYKTTVETVAYDYDELNPLNYITFPLNPNADDIHVGLFNGHTVWYKYTGTQWQVEGSRLGIESQQNLDWVDILNKPTTFPPTNHTHSTYESQILALQNDVDAIELEIDGIQTNISTLDITDISGLQGALDTLQDNIDLVPGDDWGSQVVERTSAFTGNGTAGTPLGLADNAVTNTKIADGAISTTKIIDGQITNLKLGNNSVIESKIADLAVTTNKIADLNVTSDKLATSGVTAGTYTLPTIVVNNKGIVTSASNGVGITIEEALNASLVNITTSFVNVATITLGAGTWKVDGIVNSKSTLGTNELFEAELYDLTNSTFLFSSGQRVGNSAEVSLVMTKKVILTGTTNIALRLKVSGGAPVVAINGAIITAIK